jgi:cytochrome c oxidase cbb3-type subunit I
MMVVPLVILSMNFFGTLSGSWSALKTNVTLRFIAVGVIALTLVLLASVLTSVHSVAALTQFTFVTTAQVQLGLYGFFSMVVFGALYYIVPRVLCTSWASAPLIDVHFWASAVGVVLLVGSLTGGGLTQGQLLSDPSVAFTDVTKATLPYLFSAVVAFVVLAAGQLAFALNFFWTLSRASAPAVRSVKILLAAQQTEAAR